MHRFTYSELQLPLAPLESRKSVKPHGQANKYIGKAPTHGPYATLGYWWSTKVSVRLLSSLAAEFQKVILESILPKTLKEAVIVSRNLGIQDSTDDWSHEVSQMADIYSKSYCNLAVTYNRSCDDGPFLERNIDQLGTIFVEVHWDDVECHQFGLFDRNFWINQVDRAPLSKRGWVLQERFLSPRTAHFGYGQLLWDCCKVKCMRHFQWVWY